MVSKVWRDKFEELIAENAALQVQLMALQHQLTSDLSFARENVSCHCKYITQLKYIVMYDLVSSVQSVTISAYVQEMTVQGSLQFRVAQDGGICSSSTMYCFNDDLP